MKITTLFLTLIALLTAIYLARSQDPPRSGIYRIQSGAYEEWGGFVGVYWIDLPYAGQAFASLNINTNNRAQLCFLSQNQQSTFYIKLTNGVVLGDTIRFQYWTTRPFSPDPSLNTRVDYIVTNAAGRLSINGAFESSFVCCDIPYYFTHTNVTATFVPAVTLSVSNGVRLSWTSASNQNYQVQWLSDLSGANWSNWGSSMKGCGTTDGIVDGPGAAQSQKFYRVIFWP